MRKSDIYRAGTILLIVVATNNPQLAIIFQEASKLEFKDLRSEHQGRILQNRNTGRHVVTTKGSEIMSQASPQFGASCTDIHGDSVRGGEFFTPINDVCQHCKCLDGYAVSCMTFSCAKPKCSNYKRVPGKCCEYTCPDGLGLSSAAQLGIILSLSIALIVVIIIIVIMWRRSRKQKSSPKRSRNQQTSLETECNIPNNQRHLNPCSQAVIMEPMSRQTTTASSLPPYTPKKYDPEAIASCEPPPPYTPEATTLV